MALQARRNDGKQNRQASANGGYSRGTQPPCGTNHPFRRTARVINAWSRFGIFHGRKISAIFTGVKGIPIILQIGLDNNRQLEQAALLTIVEKEPDAALRALHS